MSDTRQRGRLQNYFMLNVEQILTEKGISQAELARSIGVTRQDVWCYVRGTREPGLGVLDAFASALNVRPHQLIERPLTLRTKRR